MREEKRKKRERKKILFIFSSIFETRHVHVCYEFSRIVSDFMKIVYKTNELVSSEAVKDLIDMEEGVKCQIWQKMTA